MTDQEIKKVKNHFPDLKQTLDKNRNAKFLWLERHISANRAEEIKKFKLYGVYTKADTKRVYLYYDLSSTLVGFCDRDSNGKYGIEHAFNENLTQNKDIHLTIDLELQGLLKKVLTQAMCEYETEGASGLIMDAESGEIRGMISMPMPEKPTDFLQFKNRNRNLDVLEVGSVMKLMNIGMALESNEYDLDSIVDGTGPLKVGKFEIKDFFGVNREMTLAEALWRSSNIANARIALSLGRDYQRDFLKKLGFLDPIYLMPNKKVVPALPKDWGKSSIVTISYGYGISLSALHLARGIVPLTTGFKTEPFLVKELSSSGQRQRLYSKTLVQEMRKLMLQVVQKQHKKTLNLSKYQIGAKTGTANIIEQGKYMEGKNFVTLISVFPINHPKFFVLIQMSNPAKHALKTGRFTTAGNVLPVYMKQIIDGIIDLKLLDKYFDYPLLEPLP